VATRDYSAPVEAATAKLPITGIKADVKQVDDGSGDVIRCGACAHEYQLALPPCRTVRT